LRNEIEWSSNRKLVWEDFKGIPDTLNFPVFNAVTYSSIDIKSSLHNNKSITVRALFDSSKSWVLSAGKTDSTLTHDQIHFDITELYARKVRKALNMMNLKLLNDEEKKKKLMEIKAQYENYQKKYDRETQHGKNKETQKKWEAIIKLELAKYDLYKSN
jgi:hypothetical protein